ncbi:uncharacterized protein LOC119274791 [Triticum dicoccoides]|uniref:uncharacterized protein LOC119274791 n=1 Tax=Triticum dicoccoides TaxID=85692 RepID=UPI001890252F|nr:uncharacterized protein LOC119274791 [Triticum dicoccoides]
MGAVTSHGGGHWSPPVAKICRECKVVVGCSGMQREFACSRLPVRSCIVPPLSTPPAAGSRSNSRIFDSVISFSSKFQCFRNIGFGNQLAEMVPGHNLLACYSV